MNNPSSPLTPSPGEQPSPLNPSGLGVLWLQVASLAAVQGAFTLSWVIYKAYLPQLLAQFGFPLALAATLLIVESFLAAVMEPLMGGLSDQAQRFLGTRFGFISVGVILSSALFISLPAIAIFGNPSSALRWVFIVVLITWALAMTVFRSPAMALLLKYSTPASLPLAASLVTLSGGLIGAFQPFVSKFILGLGPVFTFAIGSFVLLGVTAFLRSVNPPDTPPVIQDQNSSPTWTLNSQILTIALIFFTGAGVAWGSRFLMDTLGKVIRSQQAAANVQGIMFVIALGLALAAIPAGAIAFKQGNERAMLFGIAATTGLLLLMALSPSWGILVVVVAILVIAFSFILNGAIPYALSRVPSERAGLGIGLYFGGSAAAAAMFDLVFGSINKTPPMTGAILGAIAFLVAGLCIISSTMIAPSER
ncbi:MAG: MFS transporter [Potamolinea sp.]